VINRGRVREFKTSPERRRHSARAETRKQRAVLTNLARTRGKITNSGLIQGEPKSPKGTWNFPSRGPFVPLARRFDSRAASFARRANCEDRRVRANLKQFTTFANPSTLDLSGIIRLRRVTRNRQSMILYFYIRESRVSRRRKGKLLRVKNLQTRMKSNLSMIRFETRD